MNMEIRHRFTNNVLYAASKIAHQAFRYSGLTRSQSPRHVYLFEGGGLIKIGSAFDIELRLRQLQLSSPVPIRYLGHMANGGQRLERELHELFAPYRAHGEWFRITESQFKAQYEILRKMPREKP